MAAGLAAVAAAALVVGLALAGAGHSAPPPLRLAPAFSLPPVVEGTADAALAVPPGHPVVVSFFAAWCDPCRRELPLLAAAAARPGAPQVVGVDFSDQRPDALDLVRQAGVAFASGFDHDGLVGRRWKVDGLPVTVFVAPDGTVVDYHRGELRRSELDRLLHRLEAAHR